MSAKTRHLAAGSTVFLFCALLWYPELVSAAVTGSMRFFVTRLVPVLFPYMVLSHFFVTYEVLEPICRCMGLRGDTGGVFLMGQLCGYPMGAKMTKEMVTGGRLEHGEAAVVCALSSGASPAFLLHGIGSGLWHSTRYGVFLLTTQWTLSLVTLWLWQKRFYQNESLSNKQGDKKSMLTNASFSHVFCNAIRDSTVQTLYVSGYIVFFSLVTAVLTAVLAHLPYGERLTLLAATVLEFATGTQAAAQVGGYVGLFCTGMAVGFGGLSVLAQTAQLLEGTGISLRPYILWKLLCGILLGLLSMAWGTMEPALLRTHVAAPTMAESGSAVWLLGYIVLLGMVTAVGTKSLRRKK